MNNIATGILSSSPLSFSSSSSTLFNLNRYRQFLITSLSSSYEPKIKPNWKPRFYRKITMSSSSPSSSSASPAANSGVSPSVAGDPVTEIIKKPPPAKQYPWLIVGLGNPGKLYNRTRHNVGFEMVDAIAEAEGIPISSVSFKAFFGKGSIGNIPLMLAKPQTFMNVSGESVGAIVSFYKIPPKQVLVIYDDLDLPFGKLRLLPKGGHGGHNGMKSVINHLKGSREFPRLRIGIGRPPGKMEAASYVLRRFTKQESDELEFTFQTGIEAVRILLLQGFDKSATFVNSLKPMKVIAVAVGVVSVAAGVGIPIFYESQIDNASKRDNTQPCFPCNGTGAQSCRFCTGSGTVTVELGGGEKEVSKCINCDGAGGLTCTTCQGSGIQPRYLDRREFKDDD